ncbi:hypothetical protein SO802_015377 [Lithocarpus litseifolius]|uniref:Uncharacterized protein n=1 Tax=Lithocarpus litseifolius TaxID=425828 RepID=A0AAW2CYT7_9ROSI
MVDATIELLIDASTRKRNHELINRILIPEEAELIKKMPLARLEPSSSPHQIASVARDQLLEFLAVQPRSWPQHPLIRAQWRPPPIAAVPSLQSGGNGSSGDIYGSSVCFELGDQPGGPRGGFSSTDDSSNQ